MKHKVKKLFIGLTVASTIFATNRPFPQQLDFNNCIKPNNVTQTKINKSVTDLFDYYKSEYLTKATNTNGGYYTDASGNGAGGKNAVTVSEAHGYGMIIFALMAGYDSNAQKIFDGYFKFYKDHPSKINDLCMSWEVDANEGDKASTSASDGDMDIAYALLLAHYQWGSNGSINYLQEAKTLINDGIKESDMHQSNYRVSLGDWNSIDYNKTEDVWATRSSDWMPDHMRAYAVATGDDFWNKSSSKVYDLIGDITENYSPNTGLMPDFITGSSPKPDRTGGGTGEKQADKYSYNGCRFPWRIATDFAHYGTNDAGKALTKLTGWLRTSTNEDPDKIYAGYKLDGGKLVNYTELVFTAPFTAGLIADEDNQDFLNECWATIKDDKGDEAYATALNLLSMLLISGNWWAPQSVTYNEPSEITLTNAQIGGGMGKETLISTLSTVDGVAPFSYSTTNLDFLIRNDSLFSNRIFDAELDNPTICDIKVVDNKGNSYSENFDITVTDAGENMLQYLSWWTDIDSDGSEIDTGSALLDESSLKLSFDMGVSNEKQNIWVYGILSCDVLSKSLGNSKFITIEYRSDNAFNLTLPMTTVKDDAFHHIALPVTNGIWKTVTFDINANNFKQPSDWGNSIKFNASKVSQFEFDTDFENESGMLELRTILIDNFEASDIVGISSHKAEVLTNTKSMVIQSTSSSLKIFNFNESVKRVSIYSLTGRELFSKNISNMNGLIEVNGLSLSMGTYIVSLSGNVNINQKILIK